MSVILPTLNIFFSETYLMSIFFLIFFFGILLKLIRGR